MKTLNKRLTATLASLELESSMNSMHAKLFLNFKYQRSIFRSDHPTRHNVGVLLPSLRLGISPSTGYVYHPFNIPWARHRILGTHRILSLQLSVTSNIGKCYFALWFSGFPAPRHFGNSLSRMNWLFPAVAPILLSINGSRLNFCRTFHDWIPDIILS